MVTIRRSRNRQMGKAVRISLLVVFVGLVTMVLLTWKMYSRIFISNVELPETHAIFYIRTGWEYAEVESALTEQGMLLDERSFRWVAEKKSYTSLVKAGRYKIRSGMSNNDLVNMLRAGRQDPVMVVFNSVRTLDGVAGKVARYLEPDSAAFADWFAKEDLPQKYGFGPEDFTSMFIPETYEFFWNTSPEQFTERMKEEYEDFWDGERDRNADKMGMSRSEVITLASIVDEETLFDAENRRVAGLYINRLEQGIALQADPTLKFALGDFGLQRIINDDKEVDSRYNTYKYRGLPPGPISIPSVSAIDGVLNYEQHKYIFMCAKADFSGNHAFARTYDQHLKNARAYQRELNKKRIYR